MKIAIIIIISWFVSGITFWAGTNHKLPFGNLSDQDKEDLKFDVFMGPFGYIMLLIYKIKKRDK